eukprot:gnl/MRDRNA2_/MRDRNA2_70955_c0_seq1.p1 gnl/MRDRNA2_/MRDRNA2_70955_c0~~gnl/MRDRNA2_/MRDRNA2_70955_c0_seq1.p1  ORF type:complete len:104 (-),score=5.53 gnl/MRDRNA2_/MRDRNA2_70955_c0_seq1:110-421(-)
MALRNGRSGGRPCQRRRGRQIREADLVVHLCCPWLLSGPGRGSRQEFDAKSCSIQAASAYLIMAFGNPSTVRQIEQHRCLCFVRLGWGLPGPRRQGCRNGQWR